MALRDECADTGWSGENQQRLDRVGMEYTPDVGPTTMAEQAELGGWHKATLPVGGTPYPQGFPVGGDPEAADSAD